MTTPTSLFYLSSIMVSLWVAGCAGTMDPSPHAKNLPLVTLKKAVHFQAPDDQDVVVAAGTYGVKPIETNLLQLVPQSERTPVIIQAMPAMYDLPGDTPVARAIEQGPDDQHVVLILPGGKGLDAAGSLSGIRGRGTITLPPSLIQQTVVQQAPSIQGLNPCIGRDPQPAVTRWLPYGRVWPGGKIVFEGQNLDASRFQAAVGSPRLALTIVSATSTRIETVVPSAPEGGPYSSPAGEALTVSYKGTVGCKVLNPAFIVTDAVKVRLFQGGGTDNGYFWIRHQMDLNGEIEGARSVTILSPTDPAVKNLYPDSRVVCDWGELSSSGRGFTLTDNRINRGIFGFFRDHRVPGSLSAPAVTCKLPIKVVILDSFTNISRDEIFVMPMTLRNHRTVSVDTNKVFHTFQGVTPSLPPFGPDTGAIGDCGKLYAGSPSGSPNSTIGVTIQSNDWVFSIKSGVTSTVCRYNSTPVEANLGVAFGPFIGWNITKQGDSKRCNAQLSFGANGAIGIVHRLESIQVFLSCDPGPLGDNQVAVRGSSISLLVPNEYMPPSISLEVP